MASKPDQLMMQHGRQSLRTVHVLLRHLSFQEPQHRMRDLKGVVEVTQIVRGAGVQLPAVMAVH